MTPLRQQRCWTWELNYNIAIYCFWVVVLMEIINATVQFHIDDYFFNSLMPTVANHIIPKHKVGLIA